MAASRSFSIALAFAAVYLLWGSTYLAIRVGVEDLPPALFAGSRFIIAGLIMWVGGMVPFALGGAMIAMHAWQRQAETDASPVSGKNLA